MGKPEGKRPLGRSRRRWDGIKMDLREICLGGVDWIRLAQVRDWWRTVVSAVITLHVHAPRSWLIEYLANSVHRFVSLCSLCSQNKRQFFS
jgi:hypothetical protein